MVFDVANSVLAQEVLDMTRSALLEYSATQILIDIVLHFLISVLAILIFMEVSKLYSISRYEGLKHFKNAFLFFGIGNFTFLMIVFSLAAMKYATDIVILILIAFCVLLALVGGVSLWIARADLLYTILWRSIDNISTRKRFKFFSFAALILFVVLDEIIYEILLEYSYYGIIYKAIIFILILLMIRQNQKSSGRIGRITHPYYLWLVLLFTLNFFGAIMNPFVEFIIAEAIINVLTILVYLVIFTGIRKWTRVLTI